ncbi:MAG: 16S rRNA (cytidine(1402)-2'-O)-methyltransferase [Lachnospiraceae bacterium]|nr:16S rRNA (cytidine(1402)-2'-O)-methyltransferase [Lachnospiraceae bacterium]
MAGKLYICATPIGNLEDITYRVVRVLCEVDIIAAEDTRNSIKLLNHFNIKKPMTSYHEYNKVEKAKVLVDKMIAGENVAIITDAGTPGISDPGEELVKQAAEAGIEITSLPGAAACITALTVSALSTRRFCFEAFLPSDKKERAYVLQEMKNETRTIVMYEAPHRLKKTLNELYECLGDRKIAFCRELTKKHEDIMRVTLRQAIDYYEVNEPRGEYVIVIDGRQREELIKEKQDEWLDISVEEHYNMYVDKGIDSKEAMKMVAKDRGISKREVYSIIHGC